MNVVCALVALVLRFCHFCLSQVAPHLRRRRLPASCFRRCCHGLMLLCCRFWGFGLWGWVWLFVRVVRALVALVLRFCHFCPVWLPSPPSCFLRCCHGLMLWCCRFWGFGLWGWVWLFVNVVRALVALVLRFCHFCPVCLRWLLIFAVAVATFLLPEMLPRPHAFVL